MANPLWREYGLDAKKLFNLAKDNALALPVFYNGGENQFRIIDIPMCDSLTIGQDYTFRIQMLMPRDTVRLTFGLKDRVRSNYWNTMLEYHIKPPTAADWARVEQKYPLSVPEARAVGDIDGKAWEHMNKQLKCNKEYVFRIKPESGLEWAVVNGTEWFKNWQNDNGIYTLRVTPRKAGMMMLCVRMTEKPPKFISCLMYDVVK